MRHKQLTVLLLVLALAVSASVWAGNKKKDKKATAQMQMDARQRAQQALNRLTFGPRPGDVDRVTAMGVDKWFEQQLHPEKIDDSALEARLQPLRTLRMDARALVEQFPPPQLIKQVADGRRSMPSDKTERAIYESQVDKYRDKQEKKAAKAEPADQAGDNQGMMLTDEQKAERREARMYARDQIETACFVPVVFREQPLGVRAEQLPHAARLDRVVQQFARRGGAESEAALAGFDARQHQQVFREASHASGVLTNDFEEIVLGGRISITG